MIENPDGSFEIPPDFPWYPADWSPGENEPAPAWCSTREGDPPLLIVDRQVVNPDG